MTVRVASLRRISLTVSDLGRMIRFYGEVLGFSHQMTEPVPLHEQASLGLGGPGTRALLRLGQQELELLCPDIPGRLYPPNSCVTDSWFQHIAIVVRDMAAAYAMISARPITPISVSGPQLLPPSSGGVTAFKFRDPDGHPLELLAFPPGAGDAQWRDNQHPGPFLGIDHSAITVADVARSIAFYQRLGLSSSTRSINEGAEQERLDGVIGVRAQVVALTPSSAATPHVELLGYEAPSVTAMGHPLATADIAATRLVFSGPGSPAPYRVLDPLLIHDPDGHGIVLDVAHLRHLNAQ